ncbi:MAG: metallophosphoesterase [bacterium]|nr:metallophosphoesterase [bacterium]
MKTTRIAVISDTHLAPEGLESRSLFPHQLDKLTVTQACRLYDDLRNGIAEANTVVMSAVCQNDEKWTALIHTGDATGGWQERGLVDQSVIDLAKKCVKQLNETTHNLHFCLGGHDTGYAHPGSLPGSGMSYSSLINCVEIFGDLWWFERYNDFCLLGICSPIASYSGSDNDLLHIQERQERVVATKIAELSETPWILFAHEPFLPNKMKPLLSGASKTCKAFIHGHRHDPKFTKFIRALGTVTRDPFLRVSHTCPSVTPLWWPGCGWMEIAIEKTKMTIKSHQVPVPESIAKLPTASFWRCLWWMLRPR